jgi:hypothetical protein
VKAKLDHQQPHIETVCHPERSEESASVFAFLAVIPEGNLLLPYFSQEKDAFLSKASFAGLTRRFRKPSFRELRDGTLTCGCLTSQIG